VAHDEPFFLLLNGDTSDEIRELGASSPTAPA
jgi:hypothetical protein